MRGIAIVAPSASGLQTRVLGGVSTRDVLFRHSPATPLWTDEAQI